MSTSQESPRRPALLLRGWCVQRKDRHIGTRVQPGTAPTH
jgi:hypothetical protein